MARPLRIDFPDTFYHVLSRGNERREIFWDDFDCNRFLELIGRMVERIGERDPAATLKLHRRRSFLRDVAVHILYELGIYRNQDIGKVFGIGYTAVSEAAKRGRMVLEANGDLNKIAREIFIDN